MKFYRCEFDDGGKGFWILPFLGVDWETGIIRIWAGWLYWLVMITFKEEE